MTLHGDVRIEDGGALWVMTGEIDAAVQARVEDTLEGGAASGAERVTVDLSGVTFMDSGGLRLLYRAASAVPQPPLLRGVPRHVRDLLELTGVDRLFELEPAPDATPAG
ncbi:STAS domain-containing protein [Xylanimonas sp. McL0601]|uniref:STAS domain-containing protein n=1 Tax=Xylanimonas sp. McL0601 TaxID=3414739 RepID=UPI003CFB2C47